MTDTGTMAHMAWSLLAMPIAIAAAHMSLHLMSIQWGQLSLGHVPPLPTQRNGIQTGNWPGTIEERGQLVLVSL
jgi:hypothetical protein